MLPEGMVHALEEIHRLLIPGGNLVDIHPTLDPVLVELYRDGSLLYSQPNPRSYAADYRNADHALEQVIQRGLFLPSGSRQFTCLTYASSVGELCEYIDRVNAHQEPSPEDIEAVKEQEFYKRVEVIRQSMGEGVEVATHESARINLLKAVK